MLSHGRGPSGLPSNLSCHTNWRLYHCRESLHMRSRFRYYCSHKTIGSPDHCSHVWPRPHLADAAQYFDNDPPHSSFTLSLRQCGIPSFTRLTVPIWPSALLTRVGFALEAVCRRNATQNTTITRRNAFTPKYSQRLPFQGVVVRFPCPTINFTFVY